MGKKLFIKSNGRIQAVEIEEVNESLAPGNYLVKFDDKGDFYYLQETQDFNIPSKIYGDLSYTERWKKAFENTEKNLGIILSGFKGSGKSLTAQYFCKQMNVPVLFITSAYKGAEFNEFITNPLFKGCIVFIDEFEKIYNGNRYDDDDANDSTKAETGLLSLMDGMFNTHLLFLLTANDHSNMNNKLKNRLGRIKYHKQFGSLHDEVVNEVCDDLLINKSHKQSLLDVVSKIPLLSMDILTTIIKDMNLFNEPADIIVKHLNLVRETLRFAITAINNKGQSCQYADRYIDLTNGTIILHFYDGNKKGKFPEETIKVTDIVLVKTDNGFTFDYKDHKFYLERSDDSANNLLF